MFQYVGIHRSDRSELMTARTRLASRAVGRLLIGSALLLSAAASAQTAGQPSPAQQPAQQEQVSVSTVGVNLNITPKRLTFDRNKRADTVHIFNQGTTAAEFDIAMVDRVMLPNGELRPVAEVAGTAEGKPIVDRLKSARDLVIVAPRRVKLAPGQGQTIRIRANQPRAGAGDAGEYRTHLTVTTIPPADVGVTAEEVANQQPGELSFRVQSVFGLSIPIIVRPGGVEAQGAIENAALSYANISPDGVAPAQRTAVLSFDMLRTGPNSLFGNVEIRSNKDKEPLGIARGIGVYPEIDRRSIRISLRRPPAAGEQLEIVFIDDDSKPGNVVARSSFTAS